MIVAQHVRSISPFQPFTFKIIIAFRGLINADIIVCVQHLLRWHVFHEGIAHLKECIDSHKCRVSD
jgi:hypothetical protein